MKAVLMSIKRRHNANIESGEKVAELRTMPPSLDPPFKVYTYESGPDGRHKVVNEWICDQKMTWRICMGVPAHLPKAACLTVEEIRKYSDGGWKDVTELHISELKVYDKPRELWKFFRKSSKCFEKPCRCCKFYNEENDGFFSCDNIITRPPQSWCYAEERWGEEMKGIKGSIGEKIFAICLDKKIAATEAERQEALSALDIQAAARLTQRLEKLMECRTRTFQPKEIVKWTRKDED